MTTYNKASLKTFFELNDVPQGTDYANLIDSQVNLVETTAQSMAGPLITTEIITPRVSATDANFTGNVSAGGIVAASLSVVSLVVTTNAVLQSSNTFLGASNFLGEITSTSAATFSKLTVTGDLPVSGNLTVTNVSASNRITALSRVSAAVYGVNRQIVSAAGTSQGAAAAIGSVVGISRLQGTADGAATGYRLASPTGVLGTVQYLIHEGAVSGNLWPDTGCSINALAGNGAFALAANTLYTVIFKSASAYAVK